MAQIDFNDAGKNSVVDAFTGGLLKGKIFKCEVCQARYGQESTNTIIKENDGRCISCNNKSIIAEPN